MQKLSESEFAIMQKIWHSDSPITAGALVDAFAQSRGWKTQTISTFLSRLVEKGMLSATRHGVQNLYSILVSEKEYRAAETRNFLDEVHGGSLQSFFASLYSLDGLTDSDIDELKDWLSRR